MLSPELITMVVTEKNFIDSVIELSKNPYGWYEVRPYTHILGLVWCSQKKYIRLRNFNYKVAMSKFRRHRYEAYYLEGRELFDMIIKVHTHKMRSQEGIELIDSLRKIYGKQGV